MLPSHIAIPCNQNREFGRIRIGGFVKSPYLSTLLAGILTPAVWETGKSAGNIIIIPETAGTYDPGEPSALKGYGSRSKTNGPRSQKLVIYDPTYVDNYEFYNAISNVTNLVPFYLTSSLVHIADVPASIFAKDPVADDLKTELDWQVTIDWESTNLPSKHAATALIEAGVFEYAEVTTTTFDTIIDFTTDESPAAVAGVTAAASVVDAEQKFKFNAAPTSAGGTSQTMDIEVNGVQELSVTYLSGRNGQAFQYIDKAGIVHSGTFASGTKSY